MTGMECGEVFYRFSELVVEKKSKARDLEYKGNYVTEITKTR